MSPRRPHHCCKRLVTVKAIHNVPMMCPQYRGNFRDRHSQLIRPTQTFCRSVFCQYVNDWRYSELVSVLPSYIYPGGYERPIWKRR